ncbi:MAG: hypothetical protein H7A48_09550 [Akkermansiaceae bacterium]|nr:hypothetical protein [Akkermansiaceae bacterium]
MFKTTLLAGAAGLLVSLSSSGRSAAADAPLRIRAYLHDPVKPMAELYVADPSGSAEKLQLVMGNLSNGQNVVPSNGSIVLYSKPFQNAAEAKESAICSAKVPSKAKSAIIVIVGMPPGTEPAYKMVVLDDGPSAFPKGESRALSLIPVEAAIEIGEHKLPLESGKICKIPAVKRKNDFNMAQTNFYYRNEERWVPFTERQMQYLEDYRRIFVVHVTPGAVAPTVTSIVDVAPAIVPKEPG